MTIDEAIKHCEEEAEKYMEYGIETECYQCGKEHEQLAEWLTELKEAKRLLKLAVAAMNGSCTVNCYNCKHKGNCDYSRHFEWKHTDEALKLIES